MSWPKIKKVVILKCHLILHNNSKPFLLLIVTFDESGFYTTAGNNQFSGWTEKFQSQTCTKKWSGSLFGGLLPVLSTTDFWIPVKPLHLKYARQIHKMPATGIGQQNGPSSRWQCPIASCTTSASKIEWIGLRRFCLMCHIPDLSPTSLFQASQQPFAGRTLLQPAGGRKCCPKSSLNPEAWIFMLQE